MTTCKDCKQVYVRTGKRTGHYAVAHGDEHAKMIEEHPTQSSTIDQLQETVKSQEKSLGIFFRSSQKTSHLLDALKGQLAASQKELERLKELLKLTGMYSEGASDDDVQ